MALALMTSDLIASKIYFLRGDKVLLDSDLALLYGVETKVLKQAVRRNIERFPDDFMFELTDKEYDNLRSQFVTSSWGRSEIFYTFSWISFSSNPAGDPAYKALRPLPIFAPALSDRCSRYFSALSAPFQILPPQSAAGLSS